MTGPLADAALTDFIDQFNAQPGPSADEVGAEGLRAGSEERAAARPKGPEMHAVRDVVVPADPDGDAVAARLYRPTPEPTGLVVYLHGGGWVIGSLATHDRACRRLAEASGLAVLALDYRRAPEHPWPAAVDDAVATLRWIASHPPELDPQPTAVAIAGDSAGGTVAALACLRTRDEAPEAMPALQALLYANTDLTNSGASMRTEGHGYGLEAPDIEWFNAQWVPDPARRARSPHRTERNPAAACGHRSPPPAGRSAGLLTGIVVSSPCRAGAGARGGTVLPRPLPPRSGLGQGLTMSA
jgi:acetyl esterase